VLRKNTFAFLKRQELVWLNVANRVLLSAWPDNVKAYDFVGSRLPKAECDWQFALG
jgi:hypothetical protein